MCVCVCVRERRSIQEERTKAPTTVGWTSPAMQEFCGTFCHLQGADKDDNADQAAAGGGGGEDWVAPQVRMPLNRGHICVYSLRPLKDGWIQRSASD